MDKAAVLDLADDVGTADLAHLVLKADWPRALCGAVVTKRFGAAAPAMDRCVDCLRIASERSLGRPGWEG